MKGRALKILCVGKIKTSHWRDACAHYLKLLGRWRDIECIEVRDAASGMDAKGRIAWEGKKLLEHIGSGDRLIALAEDGRMQTSFEFAQFIHKLDAGEAISPVFVIGGPYGLDKEVLKRSSWRLSLSPMTWPHELARVLLIEQLFRAECILRNFPYHNGKQA